MHVCVGTPQLNTTHGRLRDIAEMCMLCISVGFCFCPPFRFFVLSLALRVRSLLSPDQPGIFYFGTESYYVGRTLS